MYGRAIEGPVYAGIGPPTALTQLSSASEPDEAGRGYTIQISATLVISNLVEGARYKVGWEGGTAGSADGRDAAAELQRGDSSTSGSICRKQK